MARRVRESEDSSPILAEIEGVICLAMGAVLALSFVSYAPDKPEINKVGPVGHWLAGILVQGFGYAAYLLPGSPRGRGDALSSSGASFPAHLFGSSARWRCSWKPRSCSGCTGPTPGPRRRAAGSADSSRRFCAKRSASGGRPSFSSRWHCSYGSCSRELRFPRWLRGWFPCRWQRSTGWQSRSATGSDSASSAQPACVRAGPSSARARAGGPTRTKKTTNPKSCSANEVQVTPKRAEAIVEITGRQETRPARKGKKGEEEKEQEEFLFDVDCDDYRLPPVRLLGKHDDRTEYADEKALVAQSKILEQKLATFGVGGPRDGGPAGPGHHDLRVRARSRHQGEPRRQSLRRPHDGAARARRAHRRADSGQELSSASRSPTATARSSVCAT